MAIERYRLHEACKLQILSEIAAAKARPDLADDIRQVARLLIGGMPARSKSRETVASTTFRAAARTSGTNPQ